MTRSGELATPLAHYVGDLAAFDAIPATFLRFIKGLIRTFEDSPHFNFARCVRGYADTNSEGNRLACTPSMYEGLLLERRS